MRSQLIPNTTFSQCSLRLGYAFVTRDVLGTFWLTFQEKKYYSFSRYWRLKSIKCLSYQIKYVLPSTFAAWGFGVCTLWGLIVGMAFSSLLSSSSLLFSFMVLFDSVETPMGFLSRYNLTQLAKALYGSGSKLNQIYRHTLCWHTTFPGTIVRGNFFSFSTKKVIILERALEGDYILFQFFSSNLLFQS